MAGIGFETLVPELVEAGQKEVQRFTEKIKNRYLTAFQGLRNALINQYNSLLAKDTIENKFNYMDKLRSYLLNLEIKHHRSVLGGADIIMEKDLKQYQENVEKKIAEASMQEKLKNVRENLFSVKDNQEYMRLATRMMALVYALRRDLNEGKEEHFAMIYKGANASDASYVDIPVTQVLMSEQILDYVELSSGDISDWSGNIDQSLRFKSSVGNQLASIYKDTNVKEFQSFQDSKFLIEHYKLTGGLDIVRKSISKRGAQLRANTSKFYNESIPQLLGRNDITQAELEKGFSLNGITIYRRDLFHGYLVAEIVATGNYQLGFADQGLFAQEVQAEAKFQTFQGDNRAWYQGPDVIGGNGQEYSVKSFLGSSPSLVSYQSLYEVSNNIINIINLLDSNNTDVNTIGEVLKAKIFKLESTAESDILDFVSSSLGI